MNWGTPGEVNSQITLWLCLAMGLVARLVLKIAAEVSLMDRLLSGQAVSSLNGLSLYADDMRKLEEKHFHEFASIFAANQVPRVPLEKLVISAPFETEVSTISPDSLHVAVRSDLGLAGVQVMRNVPIEIARDCFFPDRELNEKPSWRVCIRNMFSGKQEAESGYYRFDESAPLPSHGESCGMRLDRFLSRFRYPLDVSGVFVVDVREDLDQSSVPVILLRGSQLSIITKHEEITTYFRPEAESFSFFSQLPNLYGLERAGECMICCDAPIDTLLMDCCHCCTCEACANSFRDAKCPICRSTVREKIIIPIRRDS